MKVIITGFEPFGGSDRNASWEAVRLIPNAEKILLPVTFDGAARQIREIVRSGPDAVICVGEAGGRNAVSLERIAVNLADARIPDNEGRQPTDQPVRADGPAAYFTGLPVKRILERIREKEIPAELSCTAGTYVCNTVFYSLMDEIALSGLPVKGGFIHVPAAGMPPETAADAIMTAISETCGL